MQAKKMPVGKPVEIKCIGHSYRGILRSISAEEVFLQTTHKRVALSIDQIKEIRELDDESAARLRRLMGYQK